MIILKFRLQCYVRDCCCRKQNKNKHLETTIFYAYNVFFLTAESDIATFALLKDHYTAQHPFDTNLFAPETRPVALKALYDAATKNPVHLMRQLDRWRRDGHRSSRFFLCTPVLGRRKNIRSKIDIEIETRMVSILDMKIFNFIKLCMRLHL